MKFCSTLQKFMTSRRNDFGLASQASVEAVFESTTLWSENV